MLKKHDANGDRKISVEEFASDPRMQKGFPNNDLNADGLLDERDWNAYRARRRRATRCWRCGAAGGGSDRQPEHRVADAEVPAQRALAAATAG
jgi:hypothetical protein